ncbi:hypothetical protein GQ600_1741 [Phytophthora cactorum]|nr:hypothetical protein GQ600_1741 [Phytophthora cactorum]
MTLETCSSCSTIAAFWDASSVDQAVDNNRKKRRVV